MHVPLFQRDVHHSWWPAAPAPGVRPPASGSRSSSALIPRSGPNAATAGARNGDSQSGKRWRRARPAASTSSPADHAGDGQHPPGHHPGGGAQPAQHARAGRRAGGNWWRPPHSWRWHSPATKSPTKPGSHAPARGHQQQAGIAQRRRQQGTPPHRPRSPALGDPLDGEPAQGSAHGGGGRQEARAWHRTPPGCAPRG